MTKHIFILDTELQTLAALEIVRTEKLQNTLFFSFNKNVDLYLKRLGYQSTTLDKSSKGWWGRIAMLKLLVKQLKPHMEVSPKIYTARIDLFYINVLIGTLAKDFNFTISLIPDGALNYIPEDASLRWYKNYHIWQKKTGYGLFGRLRPYRINGERIGVDSDLVTEVYAFSGAPTHYDAKKLKAIKLAKDNDSVYRNTKKHKSAIVVGQPLLRNVNASKDDVALIIERILHELKNNNINETIYCPHPRDDYDCLHSPEFNKVEHKYLCLEQYLSENPCDLVISCSSTVLINAKLMFGDTIDSISVGMETLPIPRSQQRSLKETYQLLGVKVLSL